MVASTILLALPQVAASCDPSASLSIILPAGTIFSQTSPNSSYVELTVTSIENVCPSSSLSMQNITINFGSLTPAGCGAVQLSSMDNYNYGANISGLGLLPYGSVVPRNWSIIQVLFCFLFVCLLCLFCVFLFLFLFVWC
jgi:hypothetical protein